MMDHGPSQLCGWDLRWLQRSFDVGGFPVVVRSESPARGIPTLQSINTKPLSLGWHSTA
jgi:hypothetical protein